MKILVLGAGMMGRAITYDLANYSDFEKITLVDNNNKTIQDAEGFLKNKRITYDVLDLKNKTKLQECFKKHDVVVSAVPYSFNVFLTEMAINTGCHFLDLGGNNDIVAKQRNLSENAIEKNVTIIPDCGLAPGLVSVITKDIVEQFDNIDSVKIRVGGLPQNPKPPFNYQIVFSPNGLINEYVEDAIVLDHGKIIKKKSMTEIEKINFPKPFNELEAFLTSGGTSTMPYTFKDKISYLDYKTIRYPGHCEKFKLLLEMGLGSDKPVFDGNKHIVPRDLLIDFIMDYIPVTGEDAVLVRVKANGIMNNKKIDLQYQIIDYYDKKNNMTSMMRTTGFPVSIVAQMIEKQDINQRGVFCCEEIVPCDKSFDELKKRNIIIKKEIREA
jgi:lysine 6-dehydrogenase